MISSEQSNANLEIVLLQQDNAPSHRAANTQLEIENCRTCSLMDFPVFPFLKRGLKGKKYADFFKLSRAAQTVIWYGIRTHSDRG